MKRLRSLFCAAAAALLLAACAGQTLRGTGDLGLIIERASGHVTLVNTSTRQPYARIAGLGDLSHASAVYSRDGRHAYIFGRDGGLTKIDLLRQKIDRRIAEVFGEFTPRMNGSGNCARSETVAGPGNGMAGLTAPVVFGIAFY